MSFSVIAILTIFVIELWGIRLEKHPSDSDPTHVLLVYYTVFYFAHTKIKDSKKREYKLRLPKIGLSWYPESLGLCLGILTAYHYDRFKNFFYNKTVAKLLVLLPISLFLKYIYQFYFIGNYVFRMTMGLSIIVVIFLLCSHVSVNNNISQKMGKISFEVYLYHGMFIELFQRCNVTWTSITFIGAVLICSVLLAIVMNLLSKFILTHLVKPNS